MPKSAFLNTYHLLASPAVVRIAIIVLGTLLASLIGPAAAHACAGGTGGSCGG